MTWGRLALGALGLVAAGVLALVVWRSMAPEPRYPGFSPEDVPSFNDSLRTAAMVSVRAHALPLRDDQLRDLMMPLADAIRVLGEDRAPAGTSRLRRAVATLASYGLVYSKGEWKLERFREELTQLGVDPGFIESRAIELDPDFVPGLRFSSVADWFAELTLACPWKDLKGGIRDWAPDAPIEWNYSVKVPRRVSDIARAFDPQMWDRSSTYFPKTYLAQVEAPCCPHSSSSSCVFPEGEEPPGAPDVPAGKPYGPSPLFEDYCFDKGGQCGSCGGACQVDIRNLMCVKTWYDSYPLWSSWAWYAKQYEVRFGLAAWLRSTVLGVTQSPGDQPPLQYEIVQDKGWITVDRIPEVVPKSGSDWSKVALNKKLRFSSPIVTENARVLLRVYSEEIGEQIADQACFNIPVEYWEPTWWRWLRGLFRRASLGG